MLIGAFIKDVKNGIYENGNGLLLKRKRGIYQKLYQREAYYKGKRGTCQNIGGTYHR